MKALFLWVVICTAVHTACGASKFVSLNLNSKWKSTPMLLEATYVYLTIFYSSDALYTYAKLSAFVVEISHQMIFLQVYIIFFTN